MPACESSPAAITAITAQVRPLPENVSSNLSSFAELSNSRTSLPEKRRAAASKSESARAKMRVMVKRLLRKYGYPPDKQEHATQLVLAQAEVVCEEWAV